MKVTIFCFIAWLVGMVGLLVSNVIMSKAGFGESGRFLISGLMVVVYIAILYPRFKKWGEG